MFKSNDVKQNTRTSEPQAQAINIINEGTSIKGEISSEGDIRIDGILIGNIDAKGRLVIGPKGRIEGKIVCNTIEVSGFVKGVITVTDILTMKSSSQINGEIFAGKLSVEPGAVFNGTCSMGGNVKENEKQKA